jgi:hypothetical protein
LYQAATEIGTPDANLLKAFASSLQQLADRNAASYSDPVTSELRELAAKYPDLRFATQTTDFYFRVDR